MSQQTIKLTRAERTTIGKATRRAMKIAGYSAAEETILDAATADLETRIEELGRFDEIAYTEISDYAASFARQLYPSAARNAW